MKLEITNLKDMRKCDHCFCISESVQTSMKMSPTKTEGVFMGEPTLTPHKKCCNCGLKLKD